VTYVYDLVLNFHDDLYEFYEWDKSDLIYHIKRINLIKVSSEDYNNILDNYVKMTDDFLLSIFNKCEYFENRSVLTIPYAILLTDTYRVMAITLDMDGNVLKYSSLLLDEEEDVLDISERLASINLDYQILSTRDKNNEFTRYEKHILQYIKKDLEECYEEKNVSKLKYLYYEYFNRQNDNIEKIYHSLIHELEHFQDKHRNLYQLIKLSLSRKNV